jgi:small-conductance mechanosensitive channel
MDSVASLNQLEKQLESILLGNSLGDWLIALGALIVGLTLILAFKWIAVSRLETLAKKTATRLDDALALALRKTQSWILFFPLLFFASDWLELPAGLSRVLSILATVALFLQIGIWLTVIADNLSRYSRQRAIEKNAAAATSLSAVSFVSKLVIWSIVLLLTLDNLGIDVTTLVAGLGVGGIAVALAVQNILGDLFASLSIIVDKPFEIGDFIIIGEYLGTVENIGLKTTRIRSLGGEQIIFSNSDLLASRVRNYKRMQERRVVFSFGVLYQTTAEQLEAIPKILKEIIEGIESTRFDRAHFHKFGDSSLNFEVVYYIDSGDYNLYMDRQQAINLAMVKRFAEKSIVFAYPTQSLYVEAPVPVQVTASPSLGQHKNE